MKTGLYIHIPFCRQKCLYCAFYSLAVPVQEYMAPYAAALLREAAYFKEHYFEDGNIQIGTLYIGGGTPSLLPVSFYADLIEKMSRLFDLSALEEVTFEANPEHLAADYLRDLVCYTPVNRLSIGVQSFVEEDLKMLNRRHTVRQALDAVENARKAGVENLSVDLIYGLHSEEGSSTWRYNLNLLQTLRLPHFSAYALTVEPGTSLERQLALGKLKIAAEEQMEREYFLLQEFAANNGYEAYEISNYARPGAYALHNCNYWRDVPYVGIGAAAHSYIDGQRHWNPSSLREYIADPIGGKQGEQLTERDRYHEYVMTALRTQWGVDNVRIEQFSEDLRQEFYACAENEIKCGNLLRQGNAYRVPASKRLLTDGIAASFF